MMTIEQMSRSIDEMEQSIKDGRIYAEKLKELRRKALRAIQKDLVASFDENPFDLLSKMQVHLDALYPEGSYQIRGYHRHRNDSNKDTLSIYVGEQLYMFGEMVRSPETDTRRKSYQVVERVLMQSAYPGDMPSFEEETEEEYL